MWIGPGPGVIPESGRFIGHVIQEALLAGCPVLILHSRDDKAIPHSDADVLYNAVSAEKKKVIISGPHAKGLEYDRANVLKEIKQFLRSIA